MTSAFQQSRLMVFVCFLSPCCVGFLFFNDRMGKEAGCAGFMEHLFIEALPGCRVGKNEQTVAH